MGFKLGTSKPEGSGRKKGTPNRFTQSLMEKCEKKGIDPFESLIDIALSSPEVQLKLKALTELCGYLYPKRKAMEVSGELNNPYMGMSLEELKELGKKKLEETN